MFTNFPKTVLMINGESVRTTYGDIYVLKMIFLVTFGIPFFIERLKEDKKFTPETGTIGYVATASLTYTFLKQLEKYITSNKS